MAFKLEALANTRHSHKPSFLIVNKHGHWALVGIIPNPNDSNKVTVVRMNSFGAESAVAQLTCDTISKNNLGITLEPNKPIDLSVPQQVWQSCGLAVTHNIASITGFYDLVSRNRAICEHYDPRCILATFKRGSDASPYIEILQGNYYA